MKKISFSKMQTNIISIFQNEIRIFISTISIAEYCVGGNIDQLPFKNLIVLPFNIKHAEKAGEFGRILYEAQKDKFLEVDERPIIINDAKLFAQADIEERINYYVTSDSRSMNIHNILRVKSNLNFKFIDIRNNLSETFGFLD